MSAISVAFQRRAAVFFMLALGCGPALAVVSSACAVDERVVPDIGATVTLTTDLMIKNDPAQCSLLDAFQIANDRNNDFGTNGCGEITFGPDEALVIEAGGRTFLPTTEISLGSHIAILRSATFDAKGQTRVFWVTTPDAYLILENVTIRGGKATFGGAILVEDGQLATYRSRFEDNKADFDGAAIAIQSSQLVDIRQTFFGGNKAPRNGGALYVTGSENVYVTNSRFRNNMAGSGGGIYTELSVVDIVSSYLEENEANGGDGGGVAAASDTTMRCVQFLRNRAPQGNGGALYVAPVSGIASISNSSLEANSTGTELRGKGGAIYAGGALALSQSSVFFNEGREGGAIYIADTAADDPIVIDDVTVAENVAALHGGAFWITGQNASILKPDDADSTLMGANYSMQLKHLTLYGNEAPDAQIYIADAGVNANKEILFVNNVINHDGGLKGCAGNVDRLLWQRPNDPELLDNYNVQWPGASCGEFIDVQYGSTGTRFGGVFDQAYAETIVAHPADQIVCASVRNRDQFARFSKCGLGAVRRGPPIKVSDPVAPK